MDNLLFIGTDALHSIEVSEPTKPDRVKAAKFALKHGGDEQSLEAMGLEDGEPEARLHIKKEREHADPSVRAALGIREGE